MALLFLAGLFCLFLDMDYTFSEVVKSLKGLEELTIKEEEFIELAKRIESVKKKAEVTQDLQKGRNRIKLTFVIEKEI